jgi:hypothetical protein
MSFLEAECRTTQERLLFPEDEYHQVFSRTQPKCRAKLIMLHGEIALGYILLLTALVPRVLCQNGPDIDKFKIYCMSASLARA